MAKRLSRLSNQLSDVYDKVGLSSDAARKRVIKKFAEKYEFVFFSSASNRTLPVAMLRGSTSAHGQVDNNICVGSHDGYDVVFMERTVTLTYPSLPSHSTRWHIMSFDLHSSSVLPFVFIGTKQQSKTYYARLFSAYRDIRHLDTSSLTQNKQFHANYTLVASPAEQLFVTQLLSEPVVSTMATNKLPFAIEIQADSLLVITEAVQPSLATLTQMMHYGIWLAKHIDGRITR